MKKFILWPLLFIAQIGLAQLPYTQRATTFKGQDVICPGHPQDHFSIVQAQAFIRNAKNLRGAAEKKSRFVVTYNGFSEEAKQAFQRAVDIWEYLIYSEVPIYVNAEWRVLGSNILGSANTSDFMMDFDGAPYVGTLYPMALAEKLAGKALNPDGQEDIYCRFNSSANWHYGTPETIKPGTYDLTTVVLHEIGHGLGYISTFSVSGQNASYGFGTPYKSIYDLFIEDLNGKNLVDTSAYTNNSNALFRQLTGNALYFDRQEERPKLFAPANFSAGSSISHLDDNTYRAGTENALMTATINAMEVSHDPGSLGLAVFNGLGWKGTSIVHERLRNFVERQPIEFKIRVNSDTTIKAGSVKLYYQTTAGFQSVTLQQQPGTTTYKASVNFPAELSTINYYFEVEDDFGKVVRAPGTNGVGPENYVYSFRFGQDVAGPALYHQPFLMEEVNADLMFRLIADDDFEGPLSSVQLKYKVNGGTELSVDLPKYNSAQHGPEWSLGVEDAYQYLALNPMPSLKAGDQIQYQFIVKDKSGNASILPTEYTSTRSADKPTPAYFEFTVTQLVSARSSYATDFENADADFAKVGFKIGKLNGFPTSALHSSHPYRNGLGMLDPMNDNRVLLNFERNEVALLRYPIRVGTGENTLISFDELVLVEPGDAGSTYGSNAFYDYVVVEGSFNNGVDWVPLEDGYDSRANSTWERRFLDYMSDGQYPNSTGQGHVALMKKRTMLINTGFLGSNVGANMLLRFRLFSDQLSNGWGWAIDNLYIQQNAPVVLSNEDFEGMNLYPNPAQDYIDVRTVLSSPQAVKLSVYSLLGQKLMDYTIQSSTKEFVQRLSVANLAPGQYLVQIQESTGVIFKRFTKI
jgi:hypothetical protein